MAYPIDKAGVNLTATYASAGVAPFSLGSTVRISDGGLAMLVCSSISACSTYNAVVVSQTYKAINLTTGNARSSGNQVGFAQTSIATGYCGWINLGGRPTVNLAVNCAPFVQLYTTSTAGVLDDATVSGSGGMVLGVFAGTSISNATAVVCIAQTGSTFVQPVVGT